MKKSLVAILLAGLSLGSINPVHANLPLEKELISKENCLSMNKSESYNVKIKDANNNGLIDKEEVKGRIVFTTNPPEKEGNYLITITNPNGKSVFSKDYDLEGWQGVLFDIAPEVKNYGKGEYTIKTSDGITSNTIKINVKPVK